MNRINHALLIDDRADLLISDRLPDDPDGEYKSLKSIQNYFLENSIPFSVVNRIGESPMDAIASIKLIPRPDLVVLDLDLNSDGTIDDADISLLAVLLRELQCQIGNFIVMIYSSQVERWESVKIEILAKEPSLAGLLETDNVVVSEKIMNLTVAKSELLTTELFTKTQRYFIGQLITVKAMFKRTWNKEVAVIAFFSILMLFLFKNSFTDSSPLIFYSAIAVIGIVTVKFIVSPFKP